MSETPTDLMAFYHEGRCRIGELSIDEMPSMPEKLMLAPLVKSLPHCIDAIAEADLILLGPGSFLTSIIPPLLVRDISKALSQRKGHCVFLDNVVAEQSPAAKLTLDEKLKWIEYNIDGLPVDSVITQDPEVFSDKVNIIYHDLANTDTPHHHDRDKLIESLEICISNLSAESEKKAAS